MRAKLANMECFGDICVLATNLKLTTPSVFRSQNRGKTWELVYIDTINHRYIGNDLQPANFLNLHQHDGVFVGASDDNYYYLSEDLGLSWGRGYVDGYPKGSDNNLKNYFTYKYNSLLFNRGYFVDSYSLDNGKTFDTLLLNYIPLDEKENRGFSSYGFCMQSDKYFIAYKNAWLDDKNQFNFATIIAKTSDFENFDSIYQNDQTAKGEFIDELIPNETHVFAIGSRRVEDPELGRI
ncbi:MAG: hypothetical protein Kapaf2KO_04860 [Candidatus Kapaibacteriales bacterium]